MSNFGDQEGAVCWRNGCQGVIELKPVEGCSCHIKPPCGPCSTPAEFCPVCEWCAADEPEVMNDHLIRYTDRSQGIGHSVGLRPLDPRKLDWHSFGHTNASMVKEGVYPEGMTQAEVLAQVKGTFGGRFEHFGNGRFKYIAYTD